MRSKKKLLSFVERQTFWMAPDCDEDRPRWMTSYPKEGNEEDGETLKLEIPAHLMPPGSRVTIEVPVCPECGDPADMNEPSRGEKKFWPKCECGFDWNKCAQENWG